MYAGLKRLALLAVLPVVLACCGSAGDQGEVVPGDKEARLMDWATLSPPDSPNRWLVAPAGFMALQADQEASSFNLSAMALAQAWKAVLKEQPRTEILAISDDGLQIEAQQRSRLFGFVDRVSARFIPLRPDRATLAVYSRSLVGYWDLGANRSRLQTWIERLEQSPAVQD